MTVIFESESQLRNAFAKGLEDLLQQPGMGAHILVLANALFDPQLHARLQQALTEDYRQRAQACREALSNGVQLQEAPDDLLVFLKLMALEAQGVPACRRRRAGPWEVQFNPLRAFRPGRMSAEVGAGAFAEFNPRGFNFNKPFLRPETLWRGELEGGLVDLLYNKFPFVDLHGLLVPDREACLPQYLSRKYHEYIWRLTEQLSVGMDGVGFGYNSYGASASVNHLHFQMFVREQALPVESGQWRHNGGAESYPTVCHLFTDAAEAWEYLNALHAQAQPYNLVYRPGRLYCLPRRRQGSFQASDWNGGFAWYEMAGGLVAFNGADYERLNEADLGAELALVGG